jgi:AraC family transcriptional regulator, transcriptional activator of pobA
MRRFRSLLIDKADVRLPGLHVRTFALHRHQPEHASIEPHRHAWSQAILYLSGRGRQTVAESEARVEPGTLVLLPPRVSHAFSRSDSKTPLCVMIDFRLAGAARRGAVVCSLNRSELTHVRQQLAQLMKLQKGAGGALRWEGAVAVLQVLIALLRAAGWLERVIAPASGKPSAALQTMLQTMEHALPLGEVVKRSGYQRDHFNRLVKKGAVSRAATPDEGQAIALARNASRGGGDGGRPARSELFCALVSPTDRAGAQRVDEAKISA